MPTSTKAAIDLLPDDKKGGGRSPCEQDRGAMAACLAARLWQQHAPRRPAVVSTGKSRWLFCSDYSRSRGRGLQSCAKYSSYPANVEVQSRNQGRPPNNPMRLRPAVVWAR